MPTLQEAIATLTEEAAKDVAAVTTALQAHAQPVWQAVYNRGHSDATAAKNARIADLEGQVTAAQAKVQEAETKLSEHQKKAPDVEAVRQEMQQALDKERDDAQKALAALQARLTDERKARATSDYAAALRRAGILDEWTEDFAKRDDIQGRLRFTDDGKMEILAAGSENVTLQVAAGQNPLDVLAAEHTKAIPDRYKRPQSDTGSETAGSQGSTGTTGYDPVAAGKAAAAVQKGAADNTLAFR